MNDTTLAEVETAIRNYLVQFDAMSVALNDIVTSCTFSEREIHGTSKELDQLISKHDTLSLEVNQLSTDINTIINSKHDYKQLERKYKKLREVQATLLDVNDLLASTNQKQERIDACKHGGSEVKETLAQEYKTVMNRLLHARKMFPELYARVEQETGIHFLTPPRKE